MDQEASQDLTPKRPRQDTTGVRGSPSRDSVKGQRHQQVMSRGRATKQCFASSPCPSPFLHSAEALQRKFIGNKPFKTAWQAKSAEEQRNWFIQKKELMLRDGTNKGGRGEP